MTGILAPACIDRSIHISTQREVARRLPPAARRAGPAARPRQRACATGQRVWNRHPGGGAIGLGTSPVSRVRRDAAPTTGSGTAEISAAV